MCNGHGTHSLTSVLSRQRGTRRVTVQHLRERHVIVVGQRLRCCMSVVDWEPWHGRVTRVTGGSHIVVRPEYIISCALSSTALGLTPSGGLRLTHKPGQRVTSFCSSHGGAALAAMSRGAAASYMRAEAWRGSPSKEDRCVAVEEENKESEERGAVETGSEEKEVGIRANRPSGKWRGQVSDTAHAALHAGAKQKRRYTPCFATRAEAVKALAELRDKVEQESRRHHPTARESRPAGQGLAARTRRRVHRGGQEGVLGVQLPDQACPKTNGGEEGWEARVCVDGSLRPLPSRQCGAGELGASVPPHRGLHERPEPPPLAPLLPEAHRRQHVTE